MPLTDDTQTIRDTRSLSAALMRSMLSRLTARTESHWSSLIRPSVLSRVMPAVWANMAGSRSAVGAAAPADVRRRALGRDVERHGRAADPVRGPREVLALGGDVDADHVGAVARQDL